jgi:hypothetical protein
MIPARWQWHRSRLLTPCRWRREGERIVPASLKLLVGVLYGKLSLVL